MSSRAHAEELRIKIGNYKRTRQTSVGPLRAWCDRLILEAEDELRRLSSEAEHAPLDDMPASFAATHSTFPLA